MIPHARQFLLARLVGLAAGVISAVLTARILGPEGRGELAIFTFVGLVGVSVFGFGFPTAAYDAINHGRAGARLLARFAVLVGVAIALAGIVASLSRPPDRTGIPIELALGFLIAGGVVSQALGLIAIGARRVLTATLIQVLPPVTVMAAYAIVLGLRRGDVLVACLASGGAAAVAAALGGLLLLRGLDRSDPGRSGLLTVLARGLRVIPGDVTNVLGYRIDTLLVAAIAGSAALGRYAVGVQFLEPLWAVGSAFAMSLMAIAGDTHRREDLLEATARAVRASVLVTVVGGLVAVAGVAVASRLVLGPGFTTVPVVMLLLLPGIVALGMSKVLAGAVISRGAIGLGSVVAGVSLCLNVVLNLALVPAFAEAGAAVASSGSYALSAVLWILAGRRHGINLKARDLVPRRREATDLLASMLRLRTRGAVR